MSYNQQFKSSTANNYRTVKTEYLMKPQLVNIKTLREKLNMGRDLKNNPVQLLLNIGNLLLQHT